jgi:hypothetical protein
MSFAYTIRGILDEEARVSKDVCIRTIRYWEKHIGDTALHGEALTEAGVGLLNITGVHGVFVDRLNR